MLDVRILFVVVTVSVSDGTGLEEEEEGIPSGCDIWTRTAYRGNAGRQE